MSGKRERIRDTVEMTIQFPSGLYYEAVHAADALADLFAKNGLGNFDGTDVGSGTVNLFIYDIRDADWGNALAVVIEILRELELLDKAMIVRGISWWTDDEEGTDYTTFWPEGSDKRFSLW